MPKRVSLLTDLRLFETDDEDIERRLKSHLVDIRISQNEDKKTGHPVYVSHEDRDKIRRRAAKIIAARKKYSQGRHLSRADKKALKPVLDGVYLEGPENEHQVDEIAARLFEEMPWMQKVVHQLWLDMRHHVLECGSGLKLQPTLLVGGPGLGKTHLVRRIAELSNLPTVHIDGGASSESFPVSGLTRGWSGAECGRPLKSMLANKIANPVVIVDEIDKSGTAVSSTGHSTSMHSALLGLLEPVSARDWHCPYFQVGFNMSHINWLMTCNDISRIPDLLLSRLRTIHIQPPDQKQMSEFVGKEIVRRQLSDDCHDDIMGFIEKTGKPNDVSIRFVVKLLDELQRLETLPLKH